MSTGAPWLCLLLSLLAAPLLAAPAPASAPQPEGTWGDWIIVDETPDPGASILLRRITPKSVFIAPTLSCSEGYRQDALGRCVKHVKVNQAEHWKFYLDRLNSMYAPASNKKPQKEAGPFHINLPIGSGPQQEQQIAVQKRIPATTTSTSTTTTTTTTTPPPPPTTTTVEPTTEVTLPTAVDTSEAPEYDMQASDITTERKELTENPQVMLGDQPIPTSTDQPDQPSTTTEPKNTSQAPFVIIVTNEPTTEDTVSSTVVESTTDDAESTTESSTTPTTSDYDERFSESRDVVETSPSPLPTLRPCPVTVLSDGSYEVTDCESGEEVNPVAYKRVVTVQPPPPQPSPPPATPVTLPFRMPLIVRFPEDSYPPPPPPPPRKADYVRFPGEFYNRDWVVRRRPVMQRPEEPKLSYNDWHKRYFQEDFLSRQRLRAY